jgi:hypothetical protein
VGKPPEKISLGRRRSWWDYYVKVLRIDVVSLRETVPESCSTAGFFISGVEPTGSSAMIILIT